MSGHSKWSTIKHKKGAEDAKRGKLFSKLSKMISVAAREGDSNPENNSRLRTAIEKAREANMPKDKIERALRQGAGTGEEETLRRVLYEGYGPGGVAILVAVTTDNKNRAGSEIRHIFTKNDGNMGEAGSASYLFDRVNKFTIPENSEETELKLIEAGAKEIERSEKGSLVALVTPAETSAFSEALKKEEIKFEPEGTIYIPQTKMETDKKTAGKIQKLVETLESHDDVEEVYVNI